ncbi:MAG: hypothetical protein ACXV1K_05130 [Kineosporiaceae bacterium]
MGRADVGPAAAARESSAQAWISLPWRARIRRLVAAMVAMVAVVLGGPDAVGGTVPPPPAGLPVGQDVSWPQCPAAAGGYGLPMPPADAAFVVVGLTAGRGFTANPCVASQAAWARRYAVPTSAYLVATYPTRREVLRWGAHGPRRGTTLVDRVYDVGWAQARGALAVLAVSGVRAHAVWIDVESRRTRPWSANPAANVALVQGVAAALRGSGHLTGLYTNSSSWTGFTDGARLGLPEWRTVGPRGRGAAQAACGARGLNGGPVLMVQSWTATVDTDVACPPLASAAARLRWFATP